MDFLGQPNIIMGITVDGIKGEQMLFAYLKEKGLSFFQPDAIGFINGKYYLFECKHQEYYTAPPFDGHGLPIWQVEARLKFQKQTHIPVILVVFEKPIEKTHLVYYQSLKKLDSGRQHNTEGKNRRRIYPLSNFKKEELNG